MMNRKEKKTLEKKRKGYEEEKRKGGREKKTLVWVGSSFRKEREEETRK